MMEIGGHWNWISRRDVPPESPPLRIRYGKSAEVKVTDQDHKTWKVTLYPDRMQGAISYQ
jgi:hypothetical protein